MKCTCCSSASGVVGVLGVLVIVLAIILRLLMGQNIHLFGIQTCASHLLIGANTLLLLALFLRSQKPPETN
ncbi:MAG: hypothetical protein WCO42_09860 [bacterium]